MSSKQKRDPVSRRDFLRVGGLSVVGLSMAERRAQGEAVANADRRSCIVLVMTGGASQLETFDPKPEAPSHIRGPVRSIATKLTGVRFSESLPKLAERADRLSVIRSMHHDDAPLHETGYQLLHTGRLSNGDEIAPSFGSVIAHHLGPRNDAPPYVVLPRLLSNTGINMHRGETAGMLGEQFDPVLPPANGAKSTRIGDQRFNEFRFPNPTDERVNVRRNYGENRFGDLCLQARQLVEAGTRCVVVNLFDRLQDGLTFDCHGKADGQRPVGSPGTVFDYRDTLGPQFDRAAAALLDDLADRGLLDDTLVIATSEFGRTPKLNADNGRDHWPGVWSAIMAGGGTEPGQVIGASDATASAVKSDPVHPADLIATIYQSLGVHVEDSAAVS